MILRSLTTRLACLFAVLCMVALNSVSAMLYCGLEDQLIVRDDAALLTRVEQIRALLRDSRTLQLVDERPLLFQNLLGNREALLVVRYAGEKPLLEVNPGHIAVPAVAAVAADAPLTVAALQRSKDAHGVPFVAIAADVRTGEAAGARTLRITAGRLMSERTRILASYQWEIFVTSWGATLLAAALAFYLVRRGMRPLAALATQASTIGISNLHTRLDARRAPGELAPLVVAFNAMLERLASGFTKLSQVSEDMAHDLRTPIGTLLGQTEVALGQARSAEYYHAILISNQEELQRLSHMTDNMLFLARSNHADAVIAPAWLDVGKEFERITDYFEGIAEERQLSIAGSGSGRVWGDPMLLRRALANLLSNALKYADAPSTIVLSARQEAGGVTLCVGNAGPRIEAGQLARLFDRFYRGDAARHDSSQSSGLGLAIVQTIMGLHGGRAMAVSEGDRNAFSLYFPNPA